MNFAVKRTVSFHSTVLVDVAGTNYQFIIQLLDCSGPLIIIIAAKILQVYLQKIKRQKEADGESSKWLIGGLTGSQGRDLVKGDNGYITNHTDMMTSMQDSEEVQFPCN